MKNFMEYKGYLSSITFSNEDMIFFGRLEGINDLVLFEGDSVSELQNAFQSAVEDYLETCKEKGKQPEKTYKGVFNVRVQKSIHRKLSRIAIKNGVKLNDLVNKSLLFLIDHEDQVLHKKDV